MKFELVLLRVAPLFMGIKCGGPVKNGFYFSQGPQANFLSAFQETESQTDLKLASIVGLALSTSSRYSLALNTKALTPLRQFKGIQRSVGSVGRALVIREENNGKDVVRNGQGPVAVLNPFR